MGPSTTLIGADNDTAPLFVPAVLRDTAGDDEVLVGELLAIFLRIMPPMNSRLRAAIRANNTAAIAEEVHSMRTCLAVVGAAGLQVRCKDLENAARRGQLAPGGADSALCDEIDALTAQVYDYQASRPPFPGM